MRRFRRRKEDQEEIIEGEIIEDSPPKPARRAFFRRRKPETETEEESRSVPLERISPDVPTPDEMSLAPYQPPPPAESPRKAPGRLRRLLLWREIRPGILFIALGLVAAGVYWTLRNLEAVPANLRNSWAAALLLASLIWSIGSLIARRGGAFLAGSVMAGISLSLMLDTQGYADWKDSLMGVVLITVGLGIIARGLLLRQGATVTH